MTLLAVALILCPILYLLFWPTRMAPVAWNPPKAPSLNAEPYRQNTKLKGLQRIGLIGAIGPEGINFDEQGHLYAGYLDGRVVRFSSDGIQHVVLANTRGRPLGMAPLPDGRLLIADAIRGLIQLDADGVLTVLSTQADGLP